MQNGDGRKVIAYVGGKVDRSTVSLIIVGDNLDPDQISKKLGRTPTEAKKIGENWKSNAGYEHVAKTGSWCIKAPDGSRNFSEQIRDILDELSSDYSIWDDLKNEHEIYLLCGLFLDSCNRELDLPTNILLELGKRGIDLSFDIYFSLDDE